MANPNDALALHSTVEDGEKPDGVRALKRFSERVPGYDCRHAPSQHKTKGDHGISGGAWIFAVSAGSVAVAIRICTSFFPETVPVAHRHSGWPVVKNSITGMLGFHHADPQGEECEFVDGGRCRTETGGFLVCDEFASVLAEMFDPQPEQFWTKLASFLPARSANAGKPNPSSSPEESAQNKG